MSSNTKEKYWSGKTSFDGWFHKYGATSRVREISAMPVEGVISRNCPAYGGFPASILNQLYIAIISS